MEVVQHIEKRAGKKAQLVHKPSFAEDVPSSWADISKARKLLEWEPKTYLEEGLDRLIDWYLENRDWAKEIETT